MLEAATQDEQEHVTHGNYAYDESLDHRLRWAGHNIYLPERFEESCRLDFLDKGLCFRPCRAPLSRLRSPLARSARMAPSRAHHISSAHISSHLLTLCECVCVCASERAAGRMGWKLS